MGGKSSFFSNKAIGKHPKKKIEIKKKPLEKGGFFGGMEQRLNKKKARKQERRIKNREKRKGQTPPYNPCVWLGS
jgi:hypothetical protein